MKSTLYSSRNGQDILAKIIEKCSEDIILSPETFKTKINPPKNFYLVLVTADSGISPVQKCFLTAVGNFHGVDIAEGILPFNSRSAFLRDFFTLGSACFQRKETADKYYQEVKDHLREIICFDIDVG